MKRYLLLLVFLVTFLPIAAADEYVKQITIKIQEPVVGAIPTYEASVDQHQKIRVAEVIWTGEFDNGKFVRGRNYTVAVRVMIDESSPYMFAKPSQSVITINGKKGQVTSSGQKKMKIEYDWKELGGPNPDLPENKLKASLNELAAAYIATNTTNKDDVLKYLKKEMPSAEIWLVGGAYQSTQLLPTETEDGNFSITIGITKGSVTLDGYSFTVTIPARNKSPYAQKLNEDMKRMQAALKAHTITAKTTGKEILQIVNAAAVNGTKASWDETFIHNMPTSTMQGSIEGNLILALGDRTENIRVHKILPIKGDKSDANIDADFHALAKALDNFKVTNTTTKEEVLNVADASITNGSTITCVNFSRIDATYEAEGKIVAYFELKNNDKVRSPRIAMKIDVLKAVLPPELAINQAEWEVVRQTNLQRFKQGRHLLAVASPVQDAARIRVDEICVRYSHTRPDGRACNTAIAPSFMINKIAGENIQARAESPSKAVENWMGSKGHKANILGNYCYIGVGRRANVAETSWVQLFVGNCEIKGVTSSTGTFFFNTIEDMENAYVICDTGDGIKAYIPFDADYMIQNGNQYTLRLMGKTVTVTVGNN
jgi:hypothetical protein